MRSKLMLFCLVALLVSACSDPAPVDPSAPDLGQDASVDAPETAPDLAEDEAPDLAEDEAPDAGPVLLDPEVYNTSDEAYEAVDPFIATGGLGYARGALTPAAQAPLGFVKLGPDTTRSGSHPEQLHFAGYDFGDPHVRGFSHTHFVGTGVADYGNLRLSLLTDPQTAPQTQRYMVMDKASERAEPGRYSVGLSEPQALVELVATPRAGAHRYTLPAEAPLTYLAIDAASSVRDAGVQQAHVEVDGAEVTGWVRYQGSYTGRTHGFTLHFAIALSRAPEQVGVWDDAGVRLDASSAEGVQAGALLGYARPGAAPIEARVGVSLIDLEHARVHRDQEAPPEDALETIHARTRALWMRHLTRVRVAGGTARERRVFFTALYNTYRMPSRLDEHDGQYMGLDAQPHQADWGAYYTDLSLWDTYRTTHPWYALVEPELRRDVLHTLLAMRRDGGAIPRWPAALSYTGGMIGTSADFLFGEAAAKQIADVPLAQALDALLEAAQGRVPEGARFLGREGASDYMRLGYVPDTGEGVEEATSRTLEYAHADHALATLASALDDPREAVLRERARSYARVFDAEVGFFRGRDASGGWTELYRTRYAERGPGPFTEGTAWHWRFSALHDPQGLATLYGGPDALGDALEAFLSQSQLGGARLSWALPDPYYWHGNQPSLHTIYLFQAAGRSERLAYWIDQVRSRVYTDTPAGLPGNDDGGTMSAWYLFSALGMYPIAGDDRYIVGAPMFPRAEVRLASGATLTIEAPGAGPGRRVVSEVSLNDAPLEGWILRHAQLEDATLRFTMAP